MIVKRIITILSGIAIPVLLIGIVIQGNTSELNKVRDVVEDLQTVEAAEAAGHVNINIDGCVSSPEGALGYHYVKFDLVDLELDSSEPEIMVFVPGPDGELRLGAVEYAVPIEPWDALNDVPPMVLGQTLHINEELGLYVLHAWIYEENTAGIFSDWNPGVSCLAASPISYQSKYAVDWRFSIFPSIELNLRPHL